MPWPLSLSRPGFNNENIVDPAGSIETPRDVPSIAAPNGPKKEQVMDLAKAIAPPQLCCQNHCATYSDKLISKHQAQSLLFFVDPRSATVYRYKSVTVMVFMMVFVQALASAGGDASGPHMGRESLALTKIVHAFQKAGNTTTSASQHISKPKHSVAHNNLK